MCITRVRTCVQLRVYSAPSNKLLTTAFEASIEFVAVTLQAKSSLKRSGRIPFLAFETACLETSGKSMSGSWR